MSDNPTLYFRRRSNGAAVYRISESNRTRLDFQQIAVLRPNGEVKKQGKHEITDLEHDEIASWQALQLEKDKERELARVDSLIEELNIVAQWVQADANNEDIKDIAKPIILAMHDLRATLIRRLGGK